LATVRGNRGFVNLIRERFKGGKGAPCLDAPVDQGLFCGFALIVGASMSAAVAPELRYTCLAAHNCKGDARILLARARQQA